VVVALFQRDQPQIIEALGVPFPVSQLSAELDLLLGTNSRSIVSSQEKIGLGHHPKRPDALRVTEGRVTEHLFTEADHFLKLLHCVVLLGTPQ